VISDGIDIHPSKNNAGVQAYIGDAIYELYIRRYTIQSGVSRTDAMNRFKVRYVKASAQAKVIKTILENLTEEEQGVVRRARNKKVSTKPKNADLMDYKWATAFEALLGSLFIAGNETRIEEIIEQAIEIIERK
jgi:ribonuclease-3 family protein